MELLEIRKRNTYAVFDAIIDGYNTNSLIAEKTTLSMMTVNKIIKDLLSKNILEICTFKREKTGRRPNCYSISKRFYCAYFIETYNKYLSYIAINVNGKVVDRIDYRYKVKHSLKENMDGFMLRLRKIRDYKRFCTDVFCICSDELAEYLHKGVTRIEKERFILGGLSEPEKIILFKINKKYALSVYSHISYTKPGVSSISINKVLDIDKTYEFDGDLNSGLYLAMRKKIIDKVRDMIFNKKLLQ